MKMGEYDFTELSDSRILYLRNPPRFTYIFVIAVIAILIGTIVWASVTVKAEEIESQGMIIADSSSAIVSQINGTVSAVYFTEGDAVAAGDILFSFDSTVAESERDSYAASFVYNTERRDHADTAIRALDSGATSNPFTDSGNESEFYVLFQNYLIQYNATVSDEAKEMLRYQTMTSFYNERNSCNTAIDTARTNIERYDSELEKYNVRALCDGIVHYDTDIKTGNVIQSGAQIGSVSSESGDRFVEMYVSSAQRAKISTGQECRFTIDGLLQSEFGSVYGTIDSITSDASVTEAGAFFKIRVKYDDKQMTDSKGNTVDIVNGMTAKVWCIYEESTYMKYLLDKLGIRF